ncbi:MAG: hypothetical protein HC853_11880 [Anaerolineae bacterium]|nr:hypothetical protein [Anaerolineae bacterium]
MSAAEVMLMVLSLLLYQRNHKRLWLAVYVLASTAALYTVYMSFAAHLACWLWWSAGWVRQPNRQRAVEWLLANTLAAALCLPWLSTFRGAVQTQTDVPNKPVLDVALNTAKYMAFNVYDFAVGETLSPLKPVAWVGLIAIAVVVLLGVRRRIAGKAISMLVLFVALPLMVATVITLLVGQVASPPAPNRVLYALPFFVMVLAACLAVLPKRFALAAGTVIAGCYAWGQINFFANREFMKPLLTVPWKEMMQTIVVSANASPDKTTVVICDDSDYTCFFYVQRVGLNWHGPATWPQLAPTRPQVVWFIQSNVSFRGPADTSQVLADIRQSYQQETTTNFGAQDESITAFKQRFMRVMHTPTACRYGDLNSLSHSSTRVECVWPRVICLGEVRKN